MPRLPGRPRASQTIRSICISRRSDPLPLRDAITDPWIAFDGPTMRNCLAWDVDHADGPDRIEALPPHCPRPTLVIDPHSGRAHAFLMLASPVFTGPGARPKPQGLADRAATLMGAALRANPMPRGGLLKSPWGREADLIGSLRRHTPAPVGSPLLWEAHQAAGSGLLWHTIPGDLRPVELREIIDALADEHGDMVATPRIRKQHRRRPVEADSRGRSCTLFQAALAVGVRSPRTG